MQFTDPHWTRDLQRWRESHEPPERACADNIWFEECVSAARLGRFEAAARTLPAPSALKQWQTDYCRTYVQSDDPETFHNDLDPARLGPGLLDTHQRIVRLECVPKGVLEKTGMEFDDLERGLLTANHAVLDVFLTQWNARRDHRPIFAAWKDELIDHLAHPGWADQIRDRLGLAHYNPREGGDIAVALMEYDVATVLRAATPLGIRQAFVRPTVLDSTPWPWFFPSPSDLPYGRTVNLDKTSAVFAAELLHVHISYTRDHMKRLGWIRKPADLVDVSHLRNRHLAVLRAAAHRPDFGEDMP